MCQYDFTNKRYIIFERFEQKKASNTCVNMTSQIKNISTYFELIEQLTLLALVLVYSI